MPTPIYALRLPAKVQEDIAALGKIYGAPNGRAFAREILEVTVSGDIARIQAFNSRLILRMGEQLQLEFSAAVQKAAAGARKGTKKRMKGRG